MNTAEPSSFFRSSRRLPRRSTSAKAGKEALTNSQLDRLAILALRHVQTCRFKNRFNVLLFLAALTLVLFPFIATAQTISPANLPLYFEGNNDQTEFLSSGNGYQFAISASGVHIALRDTRAHAATADMGFVGANTEAQIRGGGETAGKVNYFIGNNPSQWQTGLPTFGNVQVTELYPGINMVFHGNQRQLEYDFTIAPGADPNAIKMRFNGVGRISITSGGDLVLKIGTHELRQPKPEIYQTISGARKVIAGGYKILDSGTVAFETAGYDHALPLVIDPVLGYSGYFGGNLSDTATGLVLGPSNCICIAGETLSTKFSTIGAAQTNYAGGQFNGDAFVAKMDQTGTNLIYLTYLGGSYEDAAFGLAVDTNGDAFVTGYTDSPNFPTTNALYPTIRGKPNPLFGNIYPANAFVAELNPNGTNLIYSTYLGGTNQNAATSIAVDSSDNAYVVGYTYSGDFPVTNAFQSHLACSNNIYLNGNGFVTEIASNDTSLLYSTFLGGTNYDVAEGVALDSSNDVLVVGYTGSFNFPTTNTPGNYPNAKYLSGITNRVPGYNTYDGFVTKFPPFSTKPTNLIYSMFLGGTNDDAAFGVAADAAGNAYVTGWTASTNFPVINPPPGLWSFLTTNGNAGPVASNVFLTKITPDGSLITNSVVFGGPYSSTGYRVAVDGAGDAFVVGWEDASNFPTVNAFGSLLATNSNGRGGFDAFVTGIGADWTNVWYSVCLGDLAYTYGYGIALDSETNVYVTGATDYTNYPTFNTGRYSFNGTNVINGANYIDGTHFTGTNDAFITKITFAPSALNVSGILPTNNLTVGMGATVSFSVTATGANGQVLYQWKKNGINLINGGRISGVNTPTLTITNSQTTDSDTNYGLIISYPGLITSTPTGDTYTNTFAQSNIELTVSAYPVITTQLTNQIVYAGSTVSFSVVASGSPLTYLWSTNNSTAVTNGGQFSGATSNTLTVSDVNTNNSGYYYVVIEYPNGSYNQDYATLTVVEPLSIITAPTNQTVPAGSTVSFTVVASGFPLNYQWQTNGVDLTDGTNISGSTTGTLTLTNVQTTDGGTYTVVVDNDLQTNSLSATLTVTPLTGGIFTGFSPAAGGLVMSGTGGTTNGTYYVLTSTNLLAPVSQWTPVSTNQFDGQGQFIFTNPISTNTSQFFILKQP